jgi:hypothetical protein
VDERLVGPDLPPRRVVRDGRLVLERNTVARDILLGLWRDPATGRRPRIYGLLVTRAYSQYASMAITLRQDLAAVLQGLERPLGCSSAASWPDRYTPGLNRVFLQYAQHRGFIVDRTLPAPHRQIAALTIPNTTDPSALVFG